MTSERIKEITKKSFFDSDEKLRKTVLVNSWHMNKYESAAMWDLYASRNAGIAIQSTYERLKKSLKDTADVQIGVINYMDYVNDDMPPGIYSKFFIKRNSFKHENELRAAIFLSYTDIYRPGKIVKKKDYTTRSYIFKKKKAQGRYIDVELDTLIEKIYISPLSQPWFKDTVISVAQKYEISDNLIKISDLYKLQ